MFLPLQYFSRVKICSKSTIETISNFLWSSQDSYIVCLSIDELDHFKQIYTVNFLFFYSLKKKLSILILYLCREYTFLTLTYFETVWKEVYDKDRKEYMQDLSTAVLRHHVFRVEMEILLRFYISSVLKTRNWQIIDGYKLLPYYIGTGNIVFLSFCFFRLNVHSSWWLLREKKERDKCHSG